MLKITFLVLTSFLGVNAQTLNIYTLGQTLITGTWEGDGILQEISNEDPYDGNEHYRFNFNFQSFWSGFGLNMDNWYVGPFVDFTGYTHLRLAYKGLNDQTIAGIQLRSGQDDTGPLYQFGETSANYNVLDIPISILSGELDLSMISELLFQVTGFESASVGSFYLDGIQLVNEVVLSVNFKDVKISCNRGDVKIQWQADITDEPRGVIALQGSINAFEWKDLYVELQHQNEISFTLSGQVYNYYRLKYLGSGRDIVYSHTLFSECVEDELLSISPNPAKDFIQISIPDLGTIQTTIRLVNIWGKEIKKWNMDISHGQQLQIPHLSAGIYYLEFITKDGNSSIFKIAINN